MHYRKILVTGGAGFIGRAFVARLVEHTTASVTVLDSLGYAANRESLRELEERGVRLVVGDVADAVLVDGLVRRADAVVHFAAESHNDNSLRDPTPFVTTNVMGTYQLLEAVRRHGVRYHHISTDEVYGELELDDPARFTETTPYNPSSPYSSTKAASDLLVRAWVRSFGIEATLSNCSNNYGPYQHVEKFIPRQITEVLCGRRPRLYGSGENVRDWIHVEDHVEAVQLILERGEPGRSYLVGADGERSNLAVVRTILRLMGRGEDGIEWVRDRPGHDRRYAIDPTRLRAELGWTPSHAGIEDGLADTIEWYASHRSWWEGAKAATEAAYLAVEAPAAGSLA